MPDIQLVSPPFDSNRFAQLSHDFSQHPAMSMDSLRALAHRLAPTEQCRFIAPGLTQASSFDHQPGAIDGRSLDEVFDQIDQPGAWIALYNIETDDFYQQVLAEVRASFAPILEDQQSGVTGVGGFVFISCAPSVTPFHIDRENNFWLQIRGSKTISVWPAFDPEVISPATAEKFILNRDLENVTLTDKLSSKQTDFMMRAGDGLYFPSLTPHMTRCSPAPDQDTSEPSVSIGIVFYSDQTRHYAQASAFNRLLRLAGLNPAAPAMPNTVNPWSAKDRAKAAAGRVVIKLMKQLRGYTPPNGLEK